jgi:hypothetical protein
MSSANPDDLEFRDDFMKTDASFIAQIEALRLLILDRITYSESSPEF